MNDTAVLGDPLTVQLSTTTADEERSYFAGEVDPGLGPPHPESPLPEGTYRIVAGVLYRVMPGVPPQKEDEEQGLSISA